MKRILFVVATLALLLSACGPQATPTIDPAQVQASAIAAANTMVAMTQAAIPTATPIPPTPVPSPTFLPSPTPIPLALPTLPAAPAPAATAASSGGTDTCNGLMDIKASGPTTSVNIKNMTSGRITVSFWSPKNAFGQCGYVVAQVGVRDSATISLPLSSGGACYGVYAIINDPSKPSKAVGGPFCLNTVSTWQLTINYGSASMGR